MERLLDLAGQRFIVTGAARGIGLAISDYFHKLGAHVSQLSGPAWAPRCPACFLFKYLRTSLLSCARLASLHLD